MYAVHNKNSGSEYFDTLENDFCRALKLVKILIGCKGGGRAFTQRESISKYLQYMYMMYLTVVDCGTLSNPANSQVSHTGRTTFGQAAIYSCDAAYNLVGNSTRTCQATRVWSGSAPTCQRMFVQHLPSCLVSHVIYC